MPGYSLASPDASIIQQVRITVDHFIRFNQSTFIQSQYKLIAPESATDAKIWSVVCEFEGDDEAIQRKIGTWFQFYFSFL